MVRAAWKFPFVPPSLHDAVEAGSGLSARERRRAPALMTEARNATVTTGLLYRRIAIHNGRTFVRVVLLPPCLGHKLGAISLCKPMGARIHMDNRVAKKKREQARSVQQKKLNRSKGRGKKKPVTLKKASRNG